MRRKQWSIQHRFKYHIRERKNSSIIEAYFKELRKIIEEDSRDENDAKSISRDYFKLARIT